MVISRCYLVITHLLVLFALLCALIRVPRTNAPTSDADRTDRIEAPNGQGLIIDQPWDCLIGRVHRDEPQTDVTRGGEFKKFVGRGVRSWATVDQRNVHLAVLQGKNFPELRGANHLGVALQGQFPVAVTVRRKFEAVLAVLGVSGKVLPRGKELPVEGSLENPRGRSRGDCGLDEQIEDLVDLK